VANRNVISARASYIIFSGAAVVYTLDVYHVWQMMIANATNVLGWG
jgi:hypothetical protein